ncbi:MAG: hypothetical protein WC876_08785, partial [Candidatus Thermoplasmatota archaeon]
MQRFLAAALVCVFVAGCIEQGGTSRPSQDLDPGSNPANSDDGSGSVPSQTSTADQSSGRSPTQTPARETGFQFDVAADVPEQDLESIRRGLATAGDFLAANLGGDIPPEARSAITVKVVATGRGNDHPNGGGACCTALDPEPPYEARPFFDVAHPHWLSQTTWFWSAEAGRQSSAIHEYAHVWHAHLGCLGGQPWKGLPDWLEEGFATQVAYAALIEQGATTKGETASFMEHSAKDGEAKQWNTPLPDLHSNQVWPGHIGYLALELAMADEGHLMGLRTICTELASGTSLEAAFEAAFGV